MQYSHQISLRKIDETLIKSENVNIIGMNLEKMLRNYATEYDNEKYFFEYSDKKMYIKEKTKVIDRGWIYNGTSIKLVDAFIVELKKTVNTLIFKEMMSKKLKPINSQKIVKLEEPSVAFETKIIVEKTDTINDLDPIWKENPTYYFKLNKVSNLATISENIVYETKKETTKEIDVLNTIESCISNQNTLLNFGNLEIIRYFKEELDFKFSEKDIQKANEMGNYDIGEYLDTFNISAHDQLNGKLERCSYLDDCKLYSIREENKFWFERNGEIERELSDKHVETLHNRKFQLSIKWKIRSL